MKSLKFIKIRSSGQVAQELEKIISRQLSDGKTILWLLSGGSAIGQAVAASRLLAGKDLTQLTISLADERYGRVGHLNSNWQSLIEAGFRPGNAKVYPVLTDLGARQTAADFNQFLKQQLAESGFKLALLGIGADGHTAGILPGSPAVGSSDYAAYYQAADYGRITITPRGLAMMDQAIVYSLGHEKAQAMANLGRDLPVLDQPAQIIKQISRASVYNELKGA